MDTALLEVVVRTRHFTRQLYYILLAGLTSIAMVPSVQADDVGPPSLKFELTLPAMYNSNFGLSRSNTVDGLNVTPAGQFTLDGKFSKSLSYTVFAGIIVDRYDKGNVSRGFASDVAQAGAGLTYTMHGWDFDASYTGQWIYAPSFGNFDTRFDDYEFGLTSPAIVLGSFGSITPSLGYRERQSTDIVSSHHSPVARVTWSKTLDGLLKEWTARAILSVRYVEYDQGRAVIARDWRRVQDLSLGNL